VIAQSPAGADSGSGLVGPARLPLLLVRES